MSKRRMNKPQRMLEEYRQERALEREALVILGLVAAVILVGMLGAFG